MVRRPLVGANDAQEQMGADQRGVGVVLVAGEEGLPAAVAHLAAAAGDEVFDGDCNVTRAGGGG